MYEQLTFLEKIGYINESRIETYENYNDYACICFGCKCNRRECDRSRCPIHNAPTAYDPDKVVEQLKEATVNVCMAKTEGIGIEDKDVIMADRAIEIVQNGGKEKR